MATHPQWAKVDRIEFCQTSVTLSLSLLSATSCSSFSGFGLAYLLRLRIRMRILVCSVMSSRWWLSTSILMVSPVNMITRTMVSSLGSSDSSNSIILSMLLTKSKKPSSYCSNRALLEESFAMLEISLKLSIPSSSGRITRYDRAHCSASMVVSRASRNSNNCSGVPFTRRVSSSMGKIWRSMVSRVSSINPNGPYSASIIQFWIDSRRGGPVGYTVVVVMLSSLISSCCSAAENGVIVWVCMV